MKNQFKIILFLFFVFLLMSCGSSEKYYFQEENIYFKLKIKEKHEVDKLIYDDNKTYHYDIFSIQSNKYKDFSVYLYSKSIRDSSRFKGCDISFDNKRKFLKLKCCEGENGGCYESIYFERKVKDKFVVFRAPISLKDSIKIDFMIKEFKKIKIRTNSKKSI